MSNRLSNRDLASFFAGSVEKDEIIGAVFDHFRLDCLERSHINPSKFDGLIREFNEAQGCDLEILTAIIDMITAGQGSALDKENEVVGRISAYITKRLTEDISIEAVAEALNLSYYYMCHVFKNKVGVSVNTFRTQKRMKLAMSKLLETDEKIADIATLCGFNNVSYFTETFTKTVGVSPTVFRTQNKNVVMHGFYSFGDALLATMLPGERFLDEGVQEITPNVTRVAVREPDEQFGFLHEAAIIEYHGVLYASWYNCVKKELRGYTPICGRRSYDGGKTWTELEIICQDKSEKIMYCPPVYGICDDRLYMLVNQMVAPDHMHALDLYVLNNETGKFEFLWSRPIPFKLNTNVVTLPNGKLLLPGRVGQLDGFPITPAVLISDSGKIDGEWRLVKIAENGDLPDGKKLVHSEISVMRVEDTLYMFNRNGQRRVPLVYISEDYGETWSGAHGHDVPYILSKVYAGNLSDGRNYLIANIDRLERSKLVVYFTDGTSKKFKKRVVLFDAKTTDIPNASACHYPAACEYDGKLYIIATLNYEWSQRGAVLYVIDLKDV